METVQKISHVDFLKYHCLYRSLQMSLLIISESMRLFSVNRCVKETWLFIALKFFPFISNWLNCHRTWRPEFRENSRFERHYINIKLVATKFASLKITWGPFDAAWALSQCRSKLILEKELHWTKLWQCDTPHSASIFSRANKTSSIDPHPAVHQSSFFMNAERSISSYSFSFSQPAVADGVTVCSTATFSRADRWAPPVE